jgi:S-methylmethionine-dependent homocysteine/selenocysteine methylase
MFAFIAFVDSITSSSRIVEIIFKLNALVAIFSNVSRRYLNNIFYNRLNIKNIIKFTIDLFFVATIDTINSSNARNSLNLIRAFDIYIFIAFSFVLYLTIR